MKMSFPGVVPDQSEVLATTLPPPPPMVLDPENDWIPLVRGRGGNETPTCPYPSPGLFKE